MRGRLRLTRSAARKERRAGGEFRSLVMNTRKNMKRKSEEEQEKQREPQLQVAKAPDNAAKVGPVDVTIKQDGLAQGSAYTEAG